MSIRACNSGRSISLGSMLSPGCSPPLQTNMCANHVAPKSWPADAARPPDTVIRGFSTRWPQPMPIKMSSIGRQKQRQKLLITLSGSAKQRSPAKSQGDSSCIKRAGRISPSGVNWKTSFAHTAASLSALQPTTSLTASLASPATERSAARTIPSGPVREKDRLFLFQAASYLELSLRPLSTIDFRLTRTSQRQAIPEYLALETRQLSLQQDVHASAVR